MKGQNSFDILGLVSFYSKKLDYCIKGNNFFPRINNSITSMLPISSIGNARMWKKWKRWKNCPSSYVMLLHNRILKYWKWIVNIVNEQLIYNFKSYLSHHITKKITWIWTAFVLKIPIARKISSSEYSNPHVFLRKSTTLT